MARSKNNQLAKRDASDKQLAEKELNKWDARDLVPLVMDQKQLLEKQERKIVRLEAEVASRQELEASPEQRLLGAIAESGVAAAGGFLSPFLVAMLGEDWQEFAITDNFGIDTEAIFASGLYGLGLFLLYQDMFYGKWFFEAGKGAIASYAGHVGRNFGAQLALPAAA